MFLLLGATVAQGTLLEFPARCGDGSGFVWNAAGGGSSEVWSLTSDTSYWLLLLRLLGGLLAINFGDQQISATGWLCDDAELLDPYVKHNRSDEGCWGSLSMRESRSKPLNSFVQNSRTFSAGFKFPKGPPKAVSKPNSWHQKNNPTCCILKDSDGIFV
jgi:hypothetical protein